MRNESEQYDFWRRDEPPMTYPDVPGFVAGNATSIKAALRTAPNAASMRARVRCYIAMQGPQGATCDQVENALDMRHQTCSARIRELELAQEIKKTDCQRFTRSGSPAAVYTNREEVT